jgi:uncharacterized membrane protein YdbT with pleckstrin-like domain
MSERTVFEGRESMRAHLFAWLLGGACGFIGLISLGAVPFIDEEAGYVGLLALGLLGVALVILAAPFLSAISTKYVVTSKSVRQRQGLLSKKTSEIELADIRNIQVTQGVIDRLLGIGTVGVSTAGQSGIEIAFGMVADPEAVAALIRQARDRLGSEPVSTPVENVDRSNDDEPPVYVIP